MEFENPDKTGRIISVTVNTHTHTHTHTHIHTHTHNGFQINIYTPKIPPSRKSSLTNWNVMSHQNMMPYWWKTSTWSKIWQGGNPNRQHQYGLEELNKIKQNCNLIDIWWTQNKFKTKFTCEIDIVDFKSRKDRFYLWNHAGKIIVSALILYPILDQIVTWQVCLWKI